MSPWGKVFLFPFELGESPREGQEDCLVVARLIVWWEGAKEGVTGQVYSRFAFSDALCISMLVGWVVGWLVDKVWR